MTEIEAIKQFEQLLDQPNVEQVYQAALEATPRLIPQEFVQNHGIHLAIVFRKLKLAENYITDFFYLSKSSADWNIVFVEIEKPNTPYFKDQSDEFHPEFLTGLNQIDRWRAWISAPGNLDHLLNETLEPVWQPTVMRTNPKHVKYVLVTGRRREFLNDTKRRHLIAAKERNDFKILSYDSLIDGALKNEKVYLGVRTNSLIQILSTEFVEEGTFAWIEPERLEITRALHDNIIKDKENWRHYSAGDPKTPCLTTRLPRILISD